jgi:U3 small nucleolar RNA-associated protein 18
MLSSGSDGQVYVWDLRTWRCRHVFTDDGCVNATSIAASADGSYIACGSDSGVVNVYDAKKCETQARPTPIKSIMNIR